MHDFVLKACDVFEKIIFWCAIATVILWAVGILTPFLVEFNAVFIIIDTIGIWLVRKMAKFCKEKGID